MYGMENKIVELTKKIERCKNSCHRALLIEERAKLVAKANDSKMILVKN